MKNYHHRSTAKNKLGDKWRKHFPRKLKIVREGTGCTLLQIVCGKKRVPKHTCILTPTPFRLPFFEFVRDISTTNPSLINTPLGLNYNISRDSRQRFHVFDV